MADPSDPTHVIVLIDTQDGRPKHTVMSVLGMMTQDDAERAALRINDAAGNEWFYADVCELAKFSPDVELEPLIRELNGVDA